MPGREMVPYASSYGVDNLAVQEALRTAAVVVLDESILATSQLLSAWDLKDIADHRDDKELADLAERLVAQSPSMAITSRLPAIYESRYDSPSFLKNWSISVAIVGWKLAQAKQLLLTNIAEELALHVIIEDAITGIELAVSNDSEAEAALKDLYEDAFEDEDFLVLYDLEDESAVGGIDKSGQLGVTDLRFEQWFEPFGSGVDRGVPHPFLME